MYLINSFDAKLKKYNREESNSAFDDQNYTEEIIRVAPYNADNKIIFDIYTTRDAIGYYQIPADVDVRVGDQIKLLGRYSDNEFHTIMQVKDSWIFNRVENKIVAIK